MRLRYERGRSIRADVVISGADGAPDVLRGQLTAPRAPDLAPNRGTVPENWRIIRRDFGERTGAGTHLTGVGPDKTGNLQAIYRKAPPSMRCRGGAGKTCQDDSSRGVEPEVPPSQSTTRARSSGDAPSKEPAVADDKPVSAETQTPARITGGRNFRLWIFSYTILVGFVKKNMCQDSC